MTSLLRLDYSSWIGLKLIGFVNRYRRDIYADMAYSDIQVTPTTHTEEETAVDENEIIIGTFADAGKEVTVRGWL